MSAGTDHVNRAQFARIVGHEHANSVTRSVREKRLPPPCLIFGHSARLWSKREGERFVALRAIGVPAEEAVELILRERELIARGSTVQEAVASTMAERDAQLAA